MSLDSHGCQQLLFWSFIIRIIDKILWEKLIREKNVAQSNEFLSEELKYLKCFLIIEPAPFFA